MRLSQLLELTLLACAVASPCVRAQTPSVTTTVAGVVFDSLEMKPLPRAVVQIAAANGIVWAKSVESDTAGRFEFPDVPEGTYLLGFYHDKLDALALTSQTLRIVIRTPAPVRVRLALPSARTIARSLCGAAAIKDSTGLLMGFVRGADDSRPRLNATLTVRWAEIVIERRSIRRNIPSVEASSGPTGLVALCGVPLGTPILLQAASTSDSSGAFELTMPPSGFLHRDVFVAPFTHATVAATDTSPEIALLRGPGRLRGKVIGASGRPVSGARVTLWGTGIETKTNESGDFLLSNLPGGTHTLDVRAVGFTPVQQPVDVVQSSGSATEIELASLGIMLDTVKVTARLYTSKREAEFERRLRTSQGHVFTEEDIDKRRPMFLTDLLRTVPGVRITPTTYGQDVLMRGDFNGMCRPAVFIDGAKIFSDPSFPLDFTAPIVDIRAVEVYSRSITVPVQYNAFNNCGAVLIWTGPRRKK